MRSVVVNRHPDRFDPVDNDSDNGVMGLWSTAIREDRIITVRSTTLPLSYPPILEARQEADRRGFLLAEVERLEWRTFLGGSAEVRLYLAPGALAEHIAVTAEAKAEVLLG